MKSCVQNITTVRYLLEIEDRSRPIDRVTLFSNYLNLYVVTVCYVYLIRHRQPDNRYRCTA